MDIYRGLCELCASVVKKIENLIEIIGKNTNHKDTKNTKKLCGEKKETWN